MKIETQEESLFVQFRHSSQTQNRNNAEKFDFKTNWNTVSVDLKMDVQAFALLQCTPTAQFAGS